MSRNPDHEGAPEGSVETGPEEHRDTLCPVCGAVLLHEKCKVVCRSRACTYRIVFNCSEF